VGSKERNSILVITLSNIGDVILTTPVIASLRAAFPDSKLTVVVGPKGRSLLEGSPEIDRLLVYDKRAGWSHKGELIRALREVSYEAVIDLRNSALPFLVAARRRSPLIRFHRARTARGRHLEVLKMTGLSGEEARAFTFFSTKEEESLSRKLREKGVDASAPFAVVAPGAGSGLKRWPLEKFSEVVDRLRRDSCLNFLVVGDEDEAFLGGELAKIDSKRVVNVAGELSLKEAAALVSKARLVLTNDSAIMHLGYELKRPVVALFGPTDHEKYGRTSRIWRIVREFPPCAPCRKAECRFDRRYCLEDLSVEKVFRACKELLNQGEIREEREERPPQRILVTRTDRLGDLVLSTPVFEALRRNSPGAYLACLAFVENREAVEGNPFLDEVILYDKKGSERNWWGNFRFARWLAEKHFDVVIHLHPTNRMHLVGWLAGIPVRIGYRKKNPWTLTHSIEDRKKEGRKHESEYNFDLLELWGPVSNGRPRPYFPLKERDQRSLHLLLRNLGLNPGQPYAVLNPSASCPSKIWSSDRFAALSDRLQKEYGLATILIGSLQDRKFAAKVSLFAEFPLKDLSGRLSIGMLGWLLKEAKVLVSNDSGPVHVARAVGTPVISIFGRNQAGLSPKRWGPLGEGGRVIHKEVACPVCLAHDCRINFLCLDVVSVEEVFSEAARLLELAPERL
jgi:heptosyltransferase-2